MSMPLVSIIIPTRNEEKNIGECLNSVLDQTYKRKEIIVVDGGSRDRTREIAKKYGAKVLEEKPPRGPANARNIGAKNSRGEIAFFIDADCVLGKNAIGNAVKVLQQSNVDGLSASAQLFPTKKLIPNLYFAERLSSKRDVSPSILWKKIFLKFLFDPNLGVGEDYDFGRRFVKSGFKHQFARNVSVYHKEPDFRGLLSESRWWGRTYRSLISKKHFRVYITFFWIVFVTLLSPLIVLSIFIPELRMLSYASLGIYFIYSILKISRAIKNDAKIKYAILIPLFKIMKYSILLIEIIKGYLKKTKFRGD